MRPCFSGNRYGAECLDDAFLVSDKTIRITNSKLGPIIKSILGISGS